MTGKNGWIKNCLKKALDGNPEIGDSVVQKTESYLNETFCEKKLRPKDLSVIADDLLSIIDAQDSPEEES